MRKTLFLTAVVFLFCALANGVEAQASCTGMCWQNGNTPYCGFTALQEGGKCTITYDAWGNALCVVWACDGSGGWVPENQGLLPWEVLPEKETVRLTQVRVTVIEPRT